MVIFSLFFLTLNLSAVVGDVKTYHTQEKHTMLLCCANTWFLVLLAQFSNVINFLFDTYVYALNFVETIFNLHDIDVYLFKKLHVLTCIANHFT